MHTYEHKSYEHTIMPDYGKLVKVDIQDEEAKDKCLMSKTAASSYIFVQAFKHSMVSQQVIVGLLYTLTTLQRDAKDLIEDARKGGCFFDTCFFLFTQSAGF